MTTHIHTPAVEVPHAARHAGWLAFGSIIAFLVPYVGVSVLDLQHDVFYGAYFAVTLVMLGAYLHVERIDMRMFLVQNWKWSLGLGAVGAVVMARNVLANSDATARPDGGYYVFELLWRGVGYGTIDALLLTVFPCIVAYNLLHGRIAGWRGHIKFVTLALPLIWLMTATYHLGYPQFREDGVGQPETGNTLISVPMLATANPIGSIVMHATMHTTAVAHCYETDTYLPPQTFVTSK